MFPNRRNAKLLLTVNLFCSVCSIFVRLPEPVQMHEVHENVQVQVQHEETSAVRVRPESQIQVPLLRSTLLLQLPADQAREKVPRRGHTESDLKQLKTYKT